MRSTNVSFQVLTAFTLLLLGLVEMTKHEVKRDFNDHTCLTNVNVKKQEVVTVKEVMVW